MQSIEITKMTHASRVRGVVVPLYDPSALSEAIFMFYWSKEQSERLGENEWKTVSNIALSI